jgi:hypothetical protein
VAVDGENARCEIELFAGIFTDAFEGAAALAEAAVRLIMDQRAWKSQWERRAWVAGALWHDSWRVQRLNLGFDSGDICVDQIVEQAA